MQQEIEYLKKKIESLEMIGGCEVTPDSVASLLCGENDHLANDPFSTEFLTNVMYNSPWSMYGILYLQLLHKSK